MNILQGLMSQYFENDSTSILRLKDDDSLNKDLQFVSDIIQSCTTNREIQNKVPFDNVVM